MHTALVRKNQAWTRSHAPTPARAHVAIRNILRGPSVQPKLKIGSANDRAEHEADAVADRVMAMHSPIGDQGTAMPTSSLNTGPNPIRRMCTECGDEIKRQPAGDKDELEVQRMAAGEGAEVDEEELIQPKEKSGKTPALNASSEGAIRGLGGGAPLPTSERAFFEPRFGRDFSDVRIHTGAAADTSARSIQARAYTLGRDIAFAKGEYTPSTPAGRRLLAHELTHTVQQGGPAHRPDHETSGLDDTISRTGVQLQRQMLPFQCPPCITTGRAHVINQPVTVQGQSATVAGIVVEMSVDAPTPYRVQDYAGVNIHENVTISSNNCSTPQQTQSGTRAFIVGSRNRVPMVGTIMPAKTNIFYDNHLIAFASAGSATCSIVRDQTYTCAGVDISRHQITTSFTPGNPPTTTKRDVTRCIQEGGGR